MIYISAQPDNKYFHWQVEVFINNAMKVGINPINIHILFAYDNGISNGSKDLKNRYPFVRFFFYENKIKNNGGYIPSLRPEILSQHFKLFEYLEDENIFYHDADIIFRDIIDFDSLINDENWYLSDTVSYVGSDYIKSKSEDLFDDMCDIVGVDKKKVEDNNNNSGGAQYLLKNIDYKFWEDVRDDSISLYRYMNKRENEERKTNNNDSYNPIQKWCADMWAVLWNGIKREHNIKISKELDFSWSSGNIRDWEKSKILHNAGITDSNNGKVFYKGDYTVESPFDGNFDNISQYSNSKNYVDAILYAKEKRPN